MPLENPLVILEGALLTVGRPLTVREMRLLFSNAYSRSDILKWLGEIQQKWSGLAVHLTEVAGGWRFSGSSELEPYLRRLTTDKPPRYSRSFLETLAIIAYKQPVTRGDIEDIRGVTVNSNIMKQLQDRDWMGGVSVTLLTRAGHPSGLRPLSFWRTSHLSPSERCRLFLKARKCSPGCRGSRISRKTARDRDLISNRILNLSRNRFPMNLMNL